MQTPRCTYLLLILAFGCGGGPADVGSASATANAPTTSPESGAFCEEHGVLEAICTKCNPKLAPVFQAKGDWCPEHGLPESVCPICHPERKGRPAEDVTPSRAQASGAPADKTKVRLKSAATADQIGIETVDASISAEAASISVPAKVVYDATKVAHVRARAPGVVQALKVDVGTKVKKGDTLALVQSGQVGADRSKISGAAARVKAAEEELKRKKDLQAEGITTRSEVVEAEKELAAARSEVDALSATLAVVGKAGPGIGGYLVEAPLGGVVTSREPTIGEVVEMNGLLFEVVDTSRVWVELEVPEADLAKASVGQQVSVTFGALAGRELLGSIEYIAPAVDPQTRTAKARLSLANPEGSLRANLFGRARILDEKAKKHVVVPRAAVQRAREQSVVFVKIAKDLYETRHVKVGSSVGEHQLEIVEGVAAGEAVVTTGSFLLKTETLKESIGAGCCEVD